MLTDFHNFYDDIYDDLKDGSDIILSKINYKSTKFSLKNVSAYIKEDKIGQGTFGEVFKMKHIDTGKLYALKRIKYETELEGFPITSLREVKILQAMKHDNIVKLHEVCWNYPTPSSKNRPEFFLVFDLCDHDLSGILSDTQFQFNLAQRKTIIYHILKGLQYLHGKNIIHRDIKTSNILIDHQGIVKIGDFGLARMIASATRSLTKPRFTGRVVTLWYRPPEILLNSNDYDCSVDMWSAGCVFAELWKREALMMGRTEIAQLGLITKLCGSISEKVWPGVSKYEETKKLTSKNEPRNVQKCLSAFIDNNQAVDLIDKLLVLNPKDRVSASDALQHEFFKTEPFCADLRQMKIKGHCYEYKMHKQNSEMEHLMNQNRNNRERNLKLFKDHQGVCERKY